MPTNGMTFIFIDSACFLYSANEIFPSVTLNFQGGASMILKAEDYLLQQVSIVSSTLYCFGHLSRLVFSETRLELDEPVGLGWTETALLQFGSTKTACTQLNCVNHAVQLPNLSNCSNWLIIKETANN